MRQSITRQKGHSRPSVRLVPVTLALTVTVTGIATPAVASTQATSTSVEATPNWQMRGTVLLIVQVRSRPIAGPLQGADLSVTSA